MISLGPSYNPNILEMLLNDVLKTSYFLFSPVLYNEDPDCQFFAWEFAEFSHLQQVSWFNVTDVFPIAVPLKLFSYPSKKHCC